MLNTVPQDYLSPQATQHLQVIAFAGDPPCFPGCAFCADDLAEVTARQIALNFTEPWPA